MVNYGGADSAYPAYLHSDMQADFVRDMSAWTAAGKMTWRETVEDGIENAPAAFLKLFKGENLGKMLVKLS